MKATLNQSLSFLAPVSCSFDSQEGFDMAGKSLEEHCANFILHHCRGESYKAYRRQCIEHWNRTYGPAFADRVAVLVKKEWKK